MLGPARTSSPDPRRDINLAVAMERHGTTIPRGSIQGGSRAHSLIAIGLVSSWVSCSLFLEQICARTAITVVAVPGVADSATFGVIVFVRLQGP